MFKVGQKVVCVRGAKSWAGHELIEGEIYTCGGESPFFNGEMLILEMPTGDQCKYWSASFYRFRPLDETFATEVLEQIKEQIEQEQLVLI